MSNPPYQLALVDTAILLEMLRGEAAALRFTMDMLSQVGRIHLSELSAMSVVAACQDTGERSQMLRFINNSRVHSVSAPIAHRALEVLKQVAPPSPLTADDAIIAATAKFHKLPLYSLDPGRFAAVPGQTAIRPY